MMIWVKGESKKVKKKKSNSFHNANDKSLENIAES